MGGLSYKGISSGVYFGFLGNILQMQGRFATNKCIFCFDSKKNNRKLICKTYKESRGGQHTPEEQERLFDLFEQIHGLRTKYLKLLGFRNILCQKGFEADDLVASVCQNLPDMDRAVVISTDSDLLQLISNRVEVFDPKKKFLWNLARFREQYGIKNPKDWAVMKAIAGCSTDGVKGIPGIGEKTAIKFLNDSLPISSKKYAKILSTEGLEIRKQNLPLVRLPFKGTKKFVLKKDVPQSWRGVLQELGITTLTQELDYRGEPK